jgi:NAD(P)-dependent dehydrogenase (short-subunit alcohol dehydrogenase family)
MKPVAVVTGASRGIGRAIAETLAATHHIVGTYRDRADAAESLAAATGADMVKCDISSVADRAALVQHLEKYAAIDLLVNNAGRAPRERRDILDATEDSFDELITTNLKGPYFLTQAIARRMVAQRKQASTPRIVFVTSISANTASVNRGDYCISKAGLSMAAQLYSVRLAAEDVLVFEVRPGIIRTDMISAVESAYDEKIKNGLLPQRRMGEGRDVAAAIQSIACGHLDYSAGQVLYVDGGFHLRAL